MWSEGSEVGEDIAIQRPRQGQGEKLDACTGHLVRAPLPALLARSLCTFSRSVESVWPVTDGTMVTDAASRRIEALFYIRF
ncbi:MAG: hypothetical protein DRJ61_10635 [Acidobacteria bacterium]|nr:MAG: hypothetical protein DRJ65_15110 [Acidobacteriota bacterium]RLE31923.1 MAG: hypothetical protein DRJ61_10635 [Acidobacteriota bacterium]